MIRLIDLPSNNHAERPPGAIIDTLVLHHTAQPLDVSLDLLRFGAVSSHYVVDANGDVYRLVDEARVAWHAGLSWWRAARGLNATSIGVEIVNPDGNRHAYPEAQRDAVITLCRAILRRHPGIPPRNVVAHSDIAPGRKDDPGTLFFWRELAAAGVGLWPAVTANAEDGPPDDAGATAGVRLWPVVTANAEDGPPDDAGATAGVGLSSGATSSDSDVPASRHASPAALDATSLAVAGALLHRFGYPPPHRFGQTDGRLVYIDSLGADGVTDIVEVAVADIVVAFQRHYRPARVDGIADAGTMARLRDLLRQAGEPDW